MQMNIQPTSAWQGDYTEIMDDEGLKNTFLGTTNIQGVDLGADPGGFTDTVQDDFVQTAPVPGTMSWRLEANTTGFVGAPCHVSIEAIPETASALSG
jgi:hypothetical protein